MNKKIVIAMILVLALTASSFAGSMADVPSNHWAYEAVNTLVAAGLIQGYPDGTFKGQNDLTRYEISVIVARLINNIEEERAAMMAEVGSEISGAISESDKGLSVAQAAQVEAVVEALLEKNMPEAEVNADDIAEILAVIEDLSVEFESELSGLGVAVQVLVQEIRGLDSRVADLEAYEPYESNVKFGGEYAVDFESVGIVADINAYNNPFTFRPGPDSLSEKSVFEQMFGLNIDFVNGPLTGNVSLKAIGEGFGPGGNNDWDLDSIEGTIAGHGFDATIESGQDGDLRPYLFDDEDVDGVVLNIYDNTYYLHSDANDFVFAGSSKLAGLNFVFGYKSAFEDLYANANKIIGVYNTYELAGFDVTPELALSGLDFASRYFTLEAKGDLGDIATTFNYKNITDQFTPIMDDGLEDTVGFDIKGETDFGRVDLMGLYRTYDGPYTSFTAEVAGDNAFDLGGMDLTADFEHSTYLNVTGATRTVFNVTGKNNMADIDVTTKLEWDQTTADFETADANFNEEDEADKFDKSLNLAYDISSTLDATADYKMGKGSTDLINHVYKLNYANAPFTAGAELDLLGDTKFNAEYKENAIIAGGLLNLDGTNEVYASYNIDKEKALDIMSVDVKPYAEIKAWMDAATVRNITLGVEGEKAISDYASLTAAYSWKDYQKDISPGNRSSYLGTFREFDLGFAYDITNNVKATADYRNLAFDGVDSNNDSANFIVNKLSAGVSASF